MSPPAGFVDGLARSLWGLSGQVAFLIAVVSLISLLARRARPSFRYALWGVVLMRLCVPVSLSLPFGVMSEVERGAWRLAAWVQRPEASLPDLPPGATHDRSSTLPAATVAVVQRVGAAAPAEPAPASRPHWRRALLLAWALGVAGGVGLVGWRARRAARLVRTLPSVERPAIVARLESLRVEMRVRRRVDLARADSVLGESGPMTFGILRPVVILPGAVVASWPLEQIEPILKHELAHVRRMDLLVNWVQIAVQIVYFFHPLVWYANRRMRQERELICDDLAAGQTAGHRKLYCRSILRVLEESQGNPWAVASGVSLGERRAWLGRRIMRIMDHGYPGHRRLGSIGAAVVLVLGAVCLVLASDKAGTATDTLDPETRRIGEEVTARTTTYTDEATFTLADGESADMPTRPNEAAVASLRVTAHRVASGYTFDLLALDATGKPLGDGEITSAAIHDGVSERLAVAFGAQRDVFCKIQLSPRGAGERVAVEVKVLFGRRPTAEQMRAALLTKGKEGQLQLAFRTIGTAVMGYKRDFGAYPATLQQLGVEVPKDVYSEAGEAVHYQAERGRFILSSCGEDGVYGNDDDQVLVVTYPSSMRSGLRHELYPLPPDVGPAQSERPGPSRQRPTGPCLLAGRAIDASTKGPVGHATVYLSYGVSSDPLFVSVAADGSFEMKDVACGSMSLSVVNTAGYQDRAYNPDGRPGEFPTFTLAEGEARRDILFELRPGHRISGRVLDDNGQPLGEPSLVVLAMEQPIDPVGGSLRKQGFIRPDGTYLIDGLPDRSYLVMVEDFRSEQQDAPYPVRYYPGTFSREEAQVITFDQQPSHGNVDIRLSKKGGLAVDGRVTDAASGTPLANVLVVVQYADALDARLATYTDASGRYHAEGLGPGRFLVVADARPQGFVRTKTPITLAREAGTATVDFALHQGVTIAGRIVAEDGSQPFRVGSRTFGSVHVAGWAPAGGRSAMMNTKASKLAPASVAGDRVSYYAGEGEDQMCNMLFPTATTFLVTGMAPGVTEIALRTGFPDRRVVRVTWKGRDVTLSGIKTRAGDEIEDVQIVVGDGPQQEE